MILIAQRLILLVINLSPATVVCSCDDGASGTASLDAWTVLIFELRKKEPEKEGAEHHEGAIDVERPFETKEIVERSAGQWPKD